MNMELAKHHARDPTSGYERLRNDPHHDYHDRSTEVNGPDGQKEEAKRPRWQGSPSGRVKTFGARVESRSVYNVYKYGISGSNHARPTNSHNYMYIA